MNIDFNLAEVEGYCHTKTTEPPVLLKTLEFATNREMPCPEMLCGKLEGRFLKMLVQLINAKNVLEIGMFTGYSALSMAEGLSADGKLVTIDIDEKVEEFAKKHFSKSPHGHKILVKMGNALDIIDTLDTVFDLVFIDADKKQYPDYFLKILPKVRAGGLIVVDNTLSSGRVLDPKASTRGKLMDQFNQMVLEHSEVETVLLPVRDGITLIRKKS